MGPEKRLRENARRSFLRVFPGGFQDEKYLSVQSFLWILGSDEYAEL